MKAKTPEYTRRAIKKYNSKFDKVYVRLPSGYSDTIRENIGLSGNAYINKLVHDDLISRGLLEKDGRTETEKE